MVSTNASKINLIDFSFPIRQVLLAVFFLSAFLLVAQAQSSSSESIIVNENTLIIDEVKDTEVFAFGKTVVVKKGVKGVLVFGGDIIVEGNVSEEAATIGGSIYQKENAFIGGDVIVFGGKYQHERSEPLRTPGKETVMYAGYEEELRNLTQHPTQIFAPALTWSYLAQRLLSTLFWFIISLFLTTIASGAVSRAVARFKISTLKIVGSGLLAFITITLGVITGFSFLPGYLSGIVGLMASLILILAYVYGRVTLQVSFGKWLQKSLLPESNHTESVALLMGSLFWTLLTSIPYLGTFAVILLFAVSLGLVITSRTSNNWQKIS